MTNEPKGNAKGKSFLDKLLAKFEKQENHFPNSLAISQVHGMIETACRYTKALTELEEFEHIDNYQTFITSSTIPYSDWQIYQDSLLELGMIMRSLATNPFLYTGNDKTTLAALDSMRKEIEKSGAIAVERAQANAEGKALKLTIRASDLLTHIQRNSHCEGISSRVILLAAMSAINIYPTLLSINTQVAFAERDWVKG